MITVRAPAKLTLRLDVSALRPDGYHEIDAEMVTLDLYDELTITERPGPIEVAVTGPAAPSGGLPADDLVSRALQTAGRAAHVHIVKRIPLGAGLGGGSADAAAVLRWAGVVDLDAAAGLGADVAFCLVGGRARVRGLGEIVEPLEHRDLTFTLLTPPVHCSTAAVYARWDALGGPHHELGNDLIDAALSVEPDLERWRDELRAATGAEPRLAGSGSTWFVEGEFPGDGRVIARTTPSS